jgi:hypothetical protein
MNQNTYIKNIEKFALPSVSMRKFKSMLESSSAGNPMFVKWRTAIPPTHRASYEMYWGKFYSNSDQSDTKQSEGMVNLVAPTTLEGWRTLTYDNISSFKFEGKTYTIN